MVTTNSNKKHTASAINAASGLSSTSKLNQKIISTNNMPIKNDLKRWHNSIVSEMVTTNSNKKHAASAINAASGLSSTSKLNQKIISTNNMPIKNDLKKWHNSIVSEMVTTNSNKKHSLGAYVIKKSPVGIL